MKLEEIGDMAVRVQPGGKHEFDWDDSRAGGGTGGVEDFWEAFKNWDGGVATD